MMEITSTVIRKSTSNPRITRKKSVKQIKETPIYQNSIKTLIRKSESRLALNQIYQKSKFIQKIGNCDKPMFLLKPRWISNVNEISSPVNLESKYWNENNNDLCSQTSRASDEWIYDNSAKYWGNLKNITNWYQNTVVRSNSKVLLSRTPNMSFTSEKVQSEATRNNCLSIMPKCRKLKANHSCNILSATENKEDAVNEFASFNPVYKKWSSRSNNFRVKVTHRNKWVSKQRY